MALPAEVKKFHLSDDERLTTQGDTERIRVATFFIGQHGPFRLEFVKREFDMAKLEEEIRREVEDLKRLTPEEFKPERRGA